MAYDYQPCGVPMPILSETVLRNAEEQYREKEQRRKALETMAEAGREIDADVKKQEGN